MEDYSGLNIFPKSHIKPYDGMSVTADVWAQAHDEHRQARRAHDLMLHGTGVVWGLNVIANDPADQYVFISPGVAIDPAGNIIVVPEQVAYDFGATVEGPLFLMLGHGEREAGGVDKDTKFIHSEFVIAARPSLPKRPSVELGRVFLSKVGQPIQNAKNASHPKDGELDLRFRVDISPRINKPISVGIVYLGRASKDVETGWAYLAAECARSSSYKLIIDTDVSLSSDLSGYDFIYLAGEGTFKLDNAPQKTLQTYMEKGNKLFAEAIDNAAEVSFNALFEKMERKLKPISKNSDLLTMPFLFAEIPSGASGKAVLADKLVLFSNAAYSLSWCGKGSDGATRSDIRSAHEWGINLISYLIG